MTWVKLDDGFATHPKIEELSDRAFRAHIAAICYSAGHLTDGRITETTAKRLRIRRQTITKLVEADLWKQNGNGWIIHDFLDYNPSRKTVMVEREKARQRQADWRARHGVTDDVTLDDVTALVTPPPTRPALYNPTALSRADANGEHGGEQNRVKSILPKRLQQIMLDSIQERLTPAQAETVAAAWQANDVELRQSMAGVESAGNPVAYLMKVCQRVAGARA